MFNSVAPDRLVQMLASGIDSSILKTLEEVYLNFWRKSGFFHVVAPIIIGDPHTILNDEIAFLW